MELTLFGVRRVFITEKMESTYGTDHCYLVIQTHRGELLKISLYDWKGEIEGETWDEGSAAGLWA